MTRLVDTNVLVYRFDPRNPAKQGVAEQVLRSGSARSELALPHQAIVEFVEVTTRPRSDLGGESILSATVARQEAELLMRQFPVLFPDEEVVLTALRGAAAYGLSWYDAHLWAYAEVNDIHEILTEDFEHGRHYGSVRAVDPFLSAADSVHELPAMYDAGA